MTTNVTQRYLQRVFTEAKEPSFEAKEQNDLCSSPRQTIQYHIVQVYAPISNAEEVEVERFYEDLQYCLELTPKKDILFIIGAGMLK